MKEGASIGPMTVVLHLHEIAMGCRAKIGRNNWITGYPLGSIKHFGHRADRMPSLRMGDHSAITKGHLLDCTDVIEIGAFTTIAGYGTQIFTHGIDVLKNRQECAPVFIGDRCLLGTRVTVVPGASIGDCCVVGAGAVVVGRNEESFRLYIGVPAKPGKEIPRDAGYFCREIGRVE